jgi:hypothetical protein
MCQNKGVFMSLCTPIICQCQHLSIESAFSVLSRTQEVSIEIETVNRTQTIRLPCPALCFLLNVKYFWTHRQPYL